MNRLSFPILMLRGSNSVGYMNLCLFCMLLISTIKLDLIKWNKTFSFYLSHSKRNEAHELEIIRITRLTPFESATTLFVIQQTDEIVNSQFYLLKTLNRSGINLNLGYTNNNEVIKSYLREIPRKWFQLWKTQRIFSRIVRSCERLWEESITKQLIRRFSPVTNPRYRMTSISSVKLTILCSTVLHSTFLTDKRVTETEPTSFHSGVLLNLVIQTPQIHSWLLSCSVL